MTTLDVPVTADAEPDVPYVGGWLLTTDHKRIGIMTLAFAFLMFFGMGVIALVMRSQLAQPGLSLVSKDTYNQLFTTHGSGMIYLAITPFAIGLGVYLVPLMIGAPAIAAPRVTMAGFWLYIVGAFSILSGFAVVGGAGKDGWFAYPPLTDAEFTPTHGQDMWFFGTFCAVLGMLLMGATVLWTILFKRMPTMTMLRLPVFVWSMVAATLMVIGAFPAFLAADSLQAIGRINPSIFSHNTTVIGYQHLFWFYGHPVVYVMFFPFVGAIAEVLSTFAGRKFFGYKFVVASLLAFSALSMSVWGHHMFTTGQVVDDFYQLTSTLLVVPAGIEYFDMIGTLIGGKLRFPVPMMFALAFIPQFLVGGLTGIMVGTPVFDYNAQDSYFVVGHFHYTLLAGSTFGFFAAVYYWFPKVTGVMLRDGLGKLHFWLMVIGVNTLVLPWFALGILGMPRRVATYPDLPWWGTLNLIATVGAGIVGLSMIAFIVNVMVSLSMKRLAGPDPWEGNTLEWATSSPPPPMNFNADYPLPKVTGFAPLLDLRLRQREAAAAAEGA